MNKNWVPEKFPNPLKTAEQNYWMGFLTGDGNVTGYEGNGYNLRCDLWPTDAYHVSNLAKYLGTRSYSYRNVVRCQIACTSGMRDLATHGLVPAKSGKEIYPRTVTKDSDFIRGFLDACGGFSIAEPKNRENTKFMSVHISKMGTNLLEGIRLRLNYILDSKVSLLKRKDRADYYISYSLGRTKTGILYDFLYKSDGPRLHRKERLVKMFAFGEKAIP